MFKWGGISSLEHDEAVMLEAALFGNIPEGNAYHVPYAPGQFRQNGLGETDGSYPQHTPRPPSPSLTAQRLIREQQVCILNKKSRAMFRLIKICCFTYMLYM